jgi:nucleoside-diphosphate-sugar epimerase
LKSFPPLPERDLVHIRDHTEELWDEARSKNFFITGGTGFFGFWLLESFIFINDALGLGATATILSRDPERFARKAPHLAARKDLLFHRGDIRNFEHPQGSYDYLIHAATDASAQLNREQPAEMLDSIVSGMRHILRFAAEADVKKMLFTSSGAIYGKQPADMPHVSEAFFGGPDCLAPASAYGEGKRVAELMAAIHSKQYDYEMKIARCFAFVGPHLPLNAHFAIGNFIRDAIEGKAICINGDGTAYRSYLYAADLAIWLWTILFKGASLCPYNVGSKKAYSISDLAGIIASSFDPKVSITIGETLTDGSAPSRYVPEVSLAETELGLSEKIPLSDALMRTLDWLRFKQ